jgi:hypothetical protein
VSDTSAAQASLEVLHGDVVVGPKGLLPVRGIDEVRGPTLLLLGGQDVVNMHSGDDRADVLDT